MKQLKTILLLISLMVFGAVGAQIQNPVNVKVSFKKVSSSEAELIFDAVIDAGWHMYSTQVVENGPNPTIINMEKISGAEVAGNLTPVGNVQKHYDEMFGADVYYFEKVGRFVQKLKLTGGAYVVEGYLEYSACNDQNCTPPTPVDFSFKGVADAAKAEELKEAEKDKDVLPVADSVVADTLLNADASAEVDSSKVAGAADYWTPVVDELKALEDGTTADTADSSLFHIFLLGMVGGFLALVTPCVWPIIPMTVSFFLKRANDRRKGLRDACTYGVSIIVIYVLLGLLVTLAFGASALNSLATNAVFNIFFFLLLVVFAASFFGAFELTLPSSWSNAVDSKAEKTGGLLSIFLMAFTLTLVSFSCTGPIIGFLLVEVSTAGGDMLAPTIGMLGFAVALALPFTLFAMFPSWLKSMPKSGGWMNTVKVVLGFVELAFALKFLSVADLAYGWGILDRETFLALWIALFALLGLYLLGKIKFPHDDDDDGKIGVPRFFLALASLAFAIYMVPGLWGAPLKAVSAFAPPMKTQDFNLYDNEIKPDFSDYEAGMEYARQQKKPVMIDFTGYGCVNCRKMEQAVWSDEKVSSIINDDYVLIQLYVDDKTPLSEPITVEENGATRKLRTVGDKWSYLQRTKFGASAQPFYVLLDNEGKPLTGSYSFNENVDEYIEFLNKGLKKYGQNN